MEYPDREALPMQNTIEDAATIPSLRPKTRRVLRRLLYRSFTVGAFEQWKALKVVTLSKHY